MVMEDDQKIFENKPIVYQLNRQLMDQKPQIIFDKYLFLYTNKDFVVIDYL